MNVTIPPVDAVELPAVRAGQLPERYGVRLQDELLGRLGPLLHPGVSVLDVGSGRVPTVDPAFRPDDCRYTGLDISAEELEAAPPGAYTDAMTADITQPLPGGGYDVIVSFQVLEHVASLGAALENLRAALNPGGTLLAVLSGSRAVFSAVARVTPHTLRVAAMSRLLGHPPEAKFPTHYDHCRHDQIVQLLAPWSSAEVVSYYRGATYFNFSRPLQRAYLAYEERLVQRDAVKFATHYLIAATR